MGNKIMHYFRLWWRYLVLVFANAAFSRIDFVSFVIGKLIRMTFLFFSLMAIFSHAPTIVGFTRGEVILFFALMNMVDLVVQLIWFRGMMSLGSVIRHGGFDAVLVRPVSVLFSIAFTGFDFFDLTTLPVAIYFLWYAFHNLSLSTSNIIVGLIAVLMSFVLVFAVNLTFAAYTFWTTELDQAWWIYRHAGYALRFPPAIFPQAAQWIFTYFFPMIVIMSFPAMAFLGRLEPYQFLWMFIVTVVWFVFALKLWKRGLRHYSSVSS